MLIQQLQQFREDPRELLTLQRKLVNSIVLLNITLSTLSGKKKKKDDEKKLAENLRSIRESLYQLICGYEGTLEKKLSEVKLWNRTTEPELKDLVSSFGRLEKLTSTTDKQYNGLHRIG
jgi:hypothetical protein